MKSDPMYGRLQGAVCAGMLFCIWVPSAVAADDAVPGTAVPAVESAGFVGFGADFPPPDQAYLVGAVLRTQGVGGGVLPDLQSTPVDSWRHRLARRLGAIPERWTSPQQLLSTGRAAFDGRLAEHVSYQGHRLQNELIAAVLSAGSREALRASGGLVRQLDLSYNTGYGSSPESVGLDMVMALMDTPRNAVYSQVGYRLQDKEHSLSTGVGYRAITDGGKALLGANAFYDYLSDPATHRLSIGLEARMSLLDLYFNWYERLNDPTANPVGPVSYSPSGWDVAVSGRLPWVPWLSLDVERYRWNRLYGESDLRGMTYSAVVTPIPMAEITLNYDNTAGAGADLAVEGRLRYRFGVPMSEQLKPLRASEFSGGVVPESRRFERARREYRHWVQTYVPCRYGLSVVMGADTVTTLELNEGTSTLWTLRATRSRAGCSDTLGIAAETDTSATTGGTRVRTASPRRLSGGIGTLGFHPEIRDITLSFTGSDLEVDRPLQVTVPFDDGRSGVNPNVALRLLVGGSGGRQAQGAAALILEVNDLGGGGADADIQLKLIRRFTLSTDLSALNEDADEQKVTVTATLDGSMPLSDTLTISLALGGTASQGTDYALSGASSIEIAAGSLSGKTMLTFTPMDDTDVEGDETLILTGTAPDSTTEDVPPIPITFSGVDTEWLLRDDDVVIRRFTLSTVLSVLNEDGGAQVVSVLNEDGGAQVVTATATLDGSLSDPLTIPLELGGTASQGTDYTLSGTLSIEIAAGSLSGETTLTFTPMMDNVKGDKTLILTSTGTAPLDFMTEDVPPIPIIFPGFSGVATEWLLQDADMPGPMDIIFSLSPSPAELYKNADGATEYEVTATLVGSGPEEVATADADIVVQVSIDDASSAAENVDYTSSGLSDVTIRKGESKITKTFTLTPKDNPDPGKTIVITATTAAADYSVVGGLTQIVLVERPPLLPIGRTQDITLRETVDSGLSFEILPDPGCVHGAVFSLQASGGASLEKDIIVEINGGTEKIPDAQEYIGSLPCAAMFTLRIKDDDIPEVGESVSLKIGDPQTSVFPSARYNIRLVDPRGRIEIERIGPRQTVSIAGRSYNGISLPEEDGSTASYQFRAVLDDAPPNVLISLPLQVYFQGMGTSVTSNQPDYMLTPSALSGVPSGWEILNDRPEDGGLAEYTVPLQVNGSAQEITVSGVLDYLDGEDQEGVLVYVPRVTNFGGDFAFAIDDTTFPTADDGVDFRTPSPGFEGPLPTRVDAIRIVDEGVLTAAYKRRLGVSWNNMGNDKFNLYVREQHFADGVFFGGNRPVCLELTGTIVGGIPLPLPAVSVPVNVEFEDGDAILNTDYRLRFDGRDVGQSITLPIGASYTEQNNDMGITSSQFTLPADSVCLEISTSLDTAREGYERIRLRFSALPANGFGALPAGGVELVDGRDDMDRGAIDVYIGDTPQVSIVDDATGRGSGPGDNPIRLSIGNPMAGDRGPAVPIWFLVDPPAVEAFTLRLDGVSAGGAVVDFSSNNDLEATGGMADLTPTQSGDRTPYPQISGGPAVDILTGTGDYASVMVPAGTGVFSIMLRAATSATSDRSGYIVIDPQPQNRNPGYTVDTQNVRDRRRIDITP